MPVYANAASKRLQILEAIANLADTITTANGFLTDVVKTHVLQGERIVEGRQMPMVCVVPSADERQTVLSCGFDEFDMDVQVVGALRITKTDDQWITAIHNFAGDIQQLVNENRQLGGLCIYAESTNVDVADSNASGNRRLAVCNVTVKVKYRIAVADMTL